jgi:uncharacterized protein
MDTLTESPRATELAPVSSGERIAALDVVRGFALIGICLMNIEFFNRPLASMGEGMPVGLTGINWLASYFVAYFVAGKFWTIFSMLFGMGFAVMLTRAETAGRGFMKPYLRRIAALAVFGALHHVFLFAGDILFSYAVAAVFLLVTLYGTWRWIVAAIVTLVALSFIPGWGPAAGSAAGTLATSGLLALYLRNERRPLGLSPMSLILLVVGCIGVIAAVVMYAMKAGPAQARGPVAVFSALFVLMAFLAQKYRNPVAARPWRAGAAFYLFVFSSMIIGGAIGYLAPPEPVTPVAVAAKAELKKPGAKPELTDAARRAEAEAAKAKYLKEQSEEIATENKVMGSGTYSELVSLRVKHFLKHAPMESNFAGVLVAMFLIGTWFIRSGVMAHTGAHLPMFRRLAFVALPFGIALGIAGSLITTHHFAGAEHDGFMLSQGLLMFGNLPACIGYVSMIVLMLHSRGAFANVKLLAPFGRMALTNYLTQSLVMGLIFLGHGLGYWGLGRAWQLVFALVLCALQVAFSHWWLARFRYGPAEWLWRAVTYMKIPAMRIDAAPAPMQAQPAQ